MATFANIYKIEPRPCYVTIGGPRKREPEVVKALFHLWSAESDVIGPSPLKGGHPGGTVSTTMAIVEFEDGKVERVPASCVRFCDGDIKKYAFLSIDTADKEEKDEQR